MIDLNNLELWFVTGSQHLYGDEPLKQVAENSKAIARALAKAAEIPLNVVFKPVLTRPEEVYNLCLEANSTPNCVGLIAWMHTFSPAKMWIAGLSALQKPFVHLHTQFNQEIPWGTIDMDFMNLNQSAHGGREFGFIGARMRINRAIVVGHWQDAEVSAELGIWTRAALAWHDSQGMKIARFGDNMRQVAVTEGDKVSAQIKFGYAVNGFGVGDLVAYIDQVSDAESDKLLDEYDQRYVVQDDLKPGGDRRGELGAAAKIEIGLRAFLEQGGFKGFTTTFEDLHGLVQLPGIAAQRLMAAGFGFGAEGDWKTAALLRSMKVIAHGLEGGTSFMEDYTYHFADGKDQVLGAHMLEICESVADGQPRLEMHPLGIGGKADPARLVFNVPAGPAINVSVIDVGNRFRMVVNEVDVVKPKVNLPKLPVARALWAPKPDLKTAAAAWILAGGAHHTGFSLAVTAKHMAVFAEMADVEFLLIDKDTAVSEFKKELRWNEIYYHLSGSLG